MYYLYILIEIKSKNTYIGYTNNLRRRIKEHNSGYNFSTKARNYRLVYYEAYLSKKDAQERERKLKQRGSSKQLLIKRIEGSIEEICT